MNLTITDNKELHVQIFAKSEWIKSMFEVGVEALFGRDSALQRSIM